MLKCLLSLPNCFVRSFLTSEGLTLTERGHMDFLSAKSASLGVFDRKFRGRNSKRNRELENFANFGSRVCEDLVYSTMSHNKVKIYLIS